MNKITEEILMIVKDFHMTHDDLILEAELVESEESYLHPQLMDCTAEDLKRAAKFYYAFMWQNIVRIFNNTMDLTPQITVDEILKQYSLKDTIYTFPLSLQSKSTMDGFMAITVNLWIPFPSIRFTLNGPPKIR